SMMRRVRMSPTTSRCAAISRAGSSPPSASCCSPHAPPPAAVPTWSRIPTRSAREECPMVSPSKLAPLSAGLGLFAALSIPPGVSAPASPAPYCGVSDFKDANAQEQRCLQQLSQLASRKGTALVLHLDSGTVKTIKSNPKACKDDNAKDCLRSHLVGYHAGARLFVILRSYYEGWDYLLISARNGAETTLGDQPHFAPDGSTFVIVDSQEEYAQPYYFAVGTVATDPPRIIWKNHDDILGEWEFQRWIDKDHVGIVLATQTKDCPQPKCDGVLARKGKDWQLEFVRASK